jgi:hypothetical protein
MVKRVVAGVIEVAILVIAAVCAVASYVGVVAAGRRVDFAPPLIEGPRVIGWLVLVLGVPLVVGVSLRWWLRRRFQSHLIPIPRVPRGLLRVFLAAYLVTAIFGTPAVQTDTSTWAIGEYKRLREAGSPRLWPAHPYIATYLAVPLLPGIIITYHEYQLNGLYGFGGFQVYAWYGLGVRTLGMLPVWLS